MGGTWEHWKGENIGGSAEGVGAGPPSSPWREPVRMLGQGGEGCANGKGSI